MIQISRLLARQLRNVFRKLAARATASIARVSFTAMTSELCIRLHRAEILGAYRLPGVFGPCEFILPLSALADFEGRTDSLVTFDASEPGMVHARWDDAGVPQVMGYEDEQSSKLPEFPSLPKEMAAVDAGFLKLLDDASHSTATDNLRYATKNIQLAGTSGTINATNGHELLQATCALPWQGDVLVPPSLVFACKELQQVDNIGKTDKHVVLQGGSWTLYLPINQEGRFPDVARVIPKKEAAVVSCYIDPEDRGFLTKAITRLPGADDENAPITLDLNGQVSIRAKASNQSQLMELVLARSKPSGTPQSLVVNRNHLARAIQLGFADLFVEGPGKPLLFADDKRRFVFTSLSGAPLATSDKALRISSMNESQGSAQVVRVAQRRNLTVKDMHDNLDGLADDEPASNGKSSKGSKQRKLKHAGLAALIDEAEALKIAVRETFVRSKALATALRRHRKQSRLVQSSLKALKELQHIEA